MKVVIVFNPTTRSCKKCFWIWQIYIPLTFFMGMYRTKSESAKLDGELAINILLGFCSKRCFFKQFLKNLGLPTFQSSQHVLGPCYDWEATPININLSHLIAQIGCKRREKSGVPFEIPLEIKFKSFYVFDEFTSKL